MLNVGGRPIWFATRPTDFRKQIDGLAALVETELGEAPLGGAVFVFSNVDRTAVKLLFWDNGGFVLVYKRLERGRFRFPKGPDGKIVMTNAELAGLLEGLDLTNVRRLPRWNPRTIT